MLMMAMLIYTLVHTLRCGLTSFTHWKNNEKFVAMLLWDIKLNMRIVYLRTDPGTQAGRQAVTHVHIEVDN